MNKFDMINQMAKMIEADPSLNVSEWQATFNFADGELVSKELVDLNGIEIEGLVEPKEDQDHHDQAVEED